jgi:S-adenosylmethionine decarboxylase
MYFEGSEKKLELIARGSNLRARPAAFWHALCELAGAKVLSHISSEQADAYLLSESSLFVWDDRVNMLTCGRTTLVKAAAFLIDELTADKVDFLSYERKNEYFPHQQETDFYNDLRVLREKIPGGAFRFGSPDEHHMLLYHMNKPFRPQGVDCTLELFMYNLNGPAREIFLKSQTLDRVRQLTRLDQILPGFQIDDHLFKPCGYSLNALRGSEYYTVHVTPEETGSYVSFETNVRLGNRISTTLRAIIDVFQPRSFDVIYFHPEKGLKAFEIAPFIQREYVRQSLACGYEVGYSTYYQSAKEPMPAVALEVDP